MLWPRRTFVTLLCILSLELARAETRVYESDFDTGIPGVAGHSVVVVEDGAADISSSEEVPFTADELVAWAMQQFDGMVGMHGDMGCSGSYPILLVDGIPLQITEVDSGTDLTWDGDGQYFERIDISEGMYSDGVGTPQQQVMRKSALVHQRFVQKIVLVCLMVICAIAFTMSIKQARDLGRAMRAATQRQKHGVETVTCRTPLLDPLPHEGAQVIPVIAVTSLDSPNLKGSP